MYLLNFNHKENCLRHYGMQPVPLHRGLLVELQNAGVKFTYRQVRPTEGSFMNFSLDVRHYGFEETKQNLDLVAKVLIY